MFMLVVISMLSATITSIVLITSIITSSSIISLPSSFLEQQRYSVRCANGGHGLGEHVPGWDRDGSQQDLYDHVHHTYHYAPQVC
jgi:hypothetical protein